mgnify:CR=1 FL=1
MLCPECQQPCPGGDLCPRCHQWVPDRETFGGQGDHYLRVLFAFSLIFLGAFFLVSNLGPGFVQTVHTLYTTGWFWLYLILFLTPVGVGIHYWAMLREEEIIVTDEYIARHSRWGDEKLAWADVRGYYYRPILFRQTRLGRISGLSGVFRGSALIARLPKVCYELIGPPTATGEPYCMRLEPGTIDDLPWLLKIIEERIGPPQEGAGAI